MPAPVKPKREPAPVPRAILFTDIVGSTRYFAAYGDQAGLRMLDRHNRALFPLIEQANGRVIKTIGDSILAVFAQPGDALRAAFALQRRLEEVRASLPEEEQMHIRVGVHYGLVTEKDNDVFGDAVNLAERVKSSAASDQVFVSRTLRDLVRADPGFTLQSVGPRALKGADEPMELFKLTGASALRRVSLWKTWARRSGRALGRHPWATAAVVAALLVVGGLWWLVRPVGPPPPRALVVMPFRNVANDPDMDYLSLAFPLDLSARLSAASSLIVRPFDSVQKYKGKDWDVTQVAQELKVGTVVEGSFLRDGQNVQVNVAIIDTRQNRQVSTEPILGVVGDTLNLLRQVAHHVVGALRLQFVDEKQVLESGTENRQAYDLYLRGLALQRQITRENNEQATADLEGAVKLDPNFARAHAALADAYVTRFWWNFSNDTVWLDRGEAAARRALELDSRLAEAHFALAHALEGKGRRAEFLRENLASLRADHRYVPALVNIARYSFFMGDFDRALHVLDRIAAVDPSQNVEMRKAINLYFAGRLEESRTENQKAEARAQGVDELTLIGTTYVWLGDLEAAERVLKRLEQLQPGYSGAAEIRAWLYTARGQVPEARREMQRFAPRASTSWGIAQLMAALYAFQGDRRQALVWLEKAVALGGPSYAWFKSDHFRLLRGDPRYEAVLQKLAEEYQPLRGEFDRVLAETSP